MKEMRGERKMERIHSKERGCCEASWEVADLKERGERKECGRKRRRGLKGHNSGFYLSVW